MCGILGVCPPRDRKTFDVALELLRHRGPDDSGTWDDEHIVLGHRRLSILDLSPSGRQPMLSRDRDDVIVFNGEIYNFLELREELVRLGETFVSESDTEVLLAAYGRWGVKALDRMNGMWAFAVWNKGTRHLLLARDRFGKKPLFYFAERGQFAFASEMKALLPFMEDVRPSMYFQWMREHIHDYEGTTYTLIEGIRRLPAGCWAEWNGTELSVHRYWETLDNLVPAPERYEDQVEEFRGLFRDACRLRMRADVPVGTGLSGGVDSGAVLGMVAEIASGDGGSRLSRDWQHAFTVSFPDSELDEASLANMVAQRAGVRSTTLTVPPSIIPERMEESCFNFEEIYQTNPLPMMELYRHMREEGVVVSIDGHGADELLAGYTESLFTAFLDCRTIGDVHNVILTYRGLFGESDQHTVPTVAALWWMFIRKWLLRSAVRTARRATGNAIRPLLGRGMRKQTRREPPAGPAGETWEFRERHPAFESLDHFGRHLYILFHETTLPTLLRNYDRYSMANGVEVRMPFLDHRLVSYAFSLSWRSKMARGFTKCILRDAVRDVVPEAVVGRREKIGFGAPPAEWLRRDARSFVLDTIRSVAFRDCEVLPDADAVRKNIETLIAMPQAKYRDAETAWRDLMVFFWHQAFLVKGVRKVRGMIKADRSTT